MVLRTPASVFNPLWRRRNESSAGDVSPVKVVAGNVLVEPSLVDLHDGCGERVDAIALTASAETSCIEGARGVGPEQWTDQSAVTVKELLSAGAQKGWRVISAGLGVELSEICVVAERRTDWRLVLPRSTRVHAFDEERR
jgi:hypothetical protein